MRSTKHDFWRAGYSPGTKFLPSANCKIALDTDKNLLKIFLTLIFLILIFHVGKGSHYRKYVVQLQGQICAATAIY